MFRYPLAINFALFLGTRTSAQCRTTPAPNPPYVPPGPYFATAVDSTFWYGSDALWTALPLDGKWTANGKDEDGSVCRTKLSLLASRLRLRTETEPKLTIAGKRLDAVAPTVAVALANAVFIPSRDGAGMMTLIDIPKAGCWEITAHYKGHDLSFVVSVEPKTPQ